MKKRDRFAPVVALFVVLLGVSYSFSRPAQKTTTSPNHVALELSVPAAFHFVAFGDTRFHDPADTEAANDAVRRALVTAIDQEHPEFVSLGGDIVYAGDDAKDWQVWNSETAIWREHKIAVYPALGNHDLKGTEQAALGSYFVHFPQLNESRFYSVRLGHNLMLVLDSALPEVSGPQGEWLRSQLNHVPEETDFVFFVFHHPCYTSSSDEKTFGGGHSARSPERALAQVLEDRQKHSRARYVVFNSHVHNYERHEHNGVLYFVTGGGGAHAYPISRKPDDLYRDPGINYHYLLAEVDHNRLTITMNKLEFKDGQAVWTKPDSVTITAPTALPAAAD